MFQLGPVRRTLKTLRQKQSLESIPPPPPPPPPPPADHWDDGLLICVVLRNPESTYSFVRFKIPAKTMDELLDMVKSDASEGIISYVRHLHDVDSDDDEQFYDYSLDPELNGPFSSELNGHCGTCVIGSVVYGISSRSVCKGDDGVCHNIHYCDFGKDVPQWNLTKPLPCHRFYPTMVSVNKQLCVIEDPGFWMSKDYYSKRSSLGLLFDPVTECCTEIPFSEFHEVDACDLKVASIGPRNLLVLDKIGQKQFYFDIENSTWIPFDVNGFEDHISSILMNPVPVLEQSTLYWLDDHGKIRAYNWENFTMFVGPVIGFSHDCNLKELNDEFMTLLHLKEELFSLIWSDGRPRLHLTVIRICLDDTSDTLSNSPHHLTASVVACYCYHLDCLFNIQAAHLLASRQLQIRD